MNAIALLICALAGLALFGISVFRIGFAGAAVVAANETEIWPRLGQFGLRWVELLAGTALMTLAICDWAWAVSA